MGISLLVVATFVAYYPAMQGQLVWNDSDYVTKPELRSVPGLARIWFDVGATEQYYPLLHSFFWMQCQLWGDHPLGYHLVNLLLHLAAVALLYLILRRLEIPGAWLAAAIFALHPVMVESVAWITEQKNTLSTVFYLGALLAYLHFDQTRRKSHYALALALYLLAMASKTVTATLPAALLVIFWWQRGSLSWRRDVLPLAPWFVLGAAAGLFTAWVERTYIGAQGSDFALTFAQRALIAGRVPWFYLGQLLWPANLIFMYPRWEVDPSVGWQWLFPLASVAIVIVLWLLRRRWRGPLAGWLLFIGTLFPVLGFLNVYWFVFSFVADHLLYLASLAVIVLAASAIALAIARLQANARWIGYLGCAALLATLGTLTWRQSEMYSDAINLYQTTIDRNPDCWMAHTNLAIVLAGMGQPQAAIDHYQQAVQIKPDCLQAQNNLGNALARAGRAEEAIPHLEAAVRLEPNSALIRNNLGVTLADLGRFSEAMEQYQQAIQLDAAYIQAYFNLAKASDKLNRSAEAIAAAEQALALARSAGRTALTNQIETWIEKFRANLSNQPAGAPPKSAPATP